MNKFDIRNYFEKIYNVRVANVNTRIQFGQLHSSYHYTFRIWRHVDHTGGVEVVPHEAFRIFNHRHMRA